MAGDFAGFKVEASRLFGTVSGTAAAARVAVRNVTTFRKVAMMADVYGGRVALDTGRYPQLMRIDFTAADTNGIADNDGGTR